MTDAGVRAFEMVAALDYERTAAVQCGILLFQQPFDDHLLHIVVQYLLRVTAKVPG